jgi:putative flippase GtrA
MFSSLAKFGLVGILNTAIDFIIFNVLTNKKIGLKKIPANLISTTIAMLVSFGLNRGFVFNATGGNIYIQSAEFFAVTAFGLYVLQSLVIYFLLEIWEWPVEFAWKIVQLFKLDKFMSHEFVRKNAAKAAATLVSLTWNYLMFSFIVFKT